MSLNKSKATDSDILDFGFSGRKRAPPAIEINFHARQSDVFFSDADEILFGGAAGGGKSFFLRAAAIIWAMQIPGVQIYIFRRTFPDLEKNHIFGPKAIPALLGKLLTESWVKWDKQKYRFHFWNGSVIHLCHCQHEKDMYDYQGAEIHILMMDELSQFTAPIYRYLRGRVRKVGLVVPEGVRGRFPKIVAGTNPGGIGHNFIKGMWIDTARPFDIWRAPLKDGGMLRQFIPARIVDNPSLLEDDPTYSDRLQGLGDPALVKAMLEGNFNIISGGMFDDIWNEDVHVIPPFQIPRTFYFDRAFDMGSSRPFACGWFAESDGSNIVFPNGSFWCPPRGTLFQIGEWYGWNGEANEGCKLSPPEIAEGIVQRESKTRIKFNPGPADNMIWSADDYGKAPINDFQSKGINWTMANKAPGTRINGWLRIRTLLKSATQYPMEDPGLYVFSNCIHTIRTLAPAPRSKTNGEDLDASYEDHALDMLRYRVLGGKMVAVGSSFGVI